MIKNQKVGSLYHEMNSFFSKPLMIERNYLNSFVKNLENKLKTKSLFDDEEEEESFEEISISQGVAVVPVHGVMVERGGLFTRLFGGAPMDLLKKEIGDLSEDPEIQTIILDIDSPGGSSLGIKELSDFIFSIRDKKTIYAIANPMACSAGYQLASACHKVYLSDHNSMVGSIGVFAEHIDISKKLEKEGIKITEVASSTGKNALSETKPLEKEGLNFLEKLVKSNFEEFVLSVSKFRSKTVDFVKSNMADGLVYYGKEAVDLGFADGFVSLDRLILESRTGKDEIFMEKLKKIKSLGELRSEFPDFYSSVIEPEINSSIESAKAEGIKEGMEQERERIKEIDEVTWEGFEEESKEAKYKTLSKASDFVLVQAKVAKEKGLNPFQKKETSPISEPVQFAPQNQFVPTGSSVAFPGAQSQGNEQEDRTAKRLENMKKGSQKVKKQLHSPQQLNYSNSSFSE